MPYKNYIYEYHAKITSGEIVAGKWIKEIYKIIVGGLEKQEYFFNAKAANKAIKFIENFCHHSKGRNDLIKLELWQKAIVSIIFGIQDAEKTRIFREIFIVIGRKNGKSLFASAIIAYMVYLEPEYGQEIYCLAPKLDQATLVYDGFYKMVQAEDELNELAKKRRSDIYYEETNSFVKPIAFNAKKSDGFNPQLVVCDEMAAWSGDAGLKQYEVMKSALGARRQPMILSISTAGYINDSIYDELMKRSTSFLKGNSKERRLLPFLYMIDDVEKWNDIEELKKANPNMGVSVPESFFMDEIAVAENSLSKRAEFLTKYCNIKQNSSIAWLEYATVDGAGIEKTLEDFRDCYAVGGIDLSQTTDLTAASVVIERDGGNVDRVNQLMQVVPENFTVLCGDDGLTVPFMACGASGLVSVTSNLVPGIMNSIVKAGLNQDMGEMLSLQKTFYPLMKGLMTLDSNPVPIKAALAMKGDIQPGVRLPLVPLPEEKEAQLSALLRRFNIL